VCCGGMSGGFKGLEKMQQQRLGLEVRRKTSTHKTYLPQNWDYPPQYPHLAVDRFGFVPMYNSFLPFRLQERRGRDDFSYALIILGLKTLLVPNTHAQYKYPICVECRVGAGKIFR